MVYLPSRLEIMGWKLFVSQASELQYYNSYEHGNNLTLKNDRQDTECLCNVAESPSNMTLPKPFSKASSRPRRANKSSTSIAVNFGKERPLLYQAHP